MPLPMSRREMLSQTGCGFGAMALAGLATQSSPVTAGERSVTAKFLANQKDEKEAWAAVFQALFASADFRYVE